MLRGSRPWAVTLCAVLVWSLAGSAVHAQEGEEQAAPAEAQAGPEVERIVVTAQRRTKDLQNAGISATVLNGEDLKDKSVFGLTALQYAAPSVTISDYGSANVFNIRGIGRSQVDVDLPSGVVIYRDGTPTLAGYFQNEPYYDMGAVEVLRGPQGTFVGKSAAGGAVFITTRTPELDHFNGMVEAGVGDYKQREFTGVVNVPVGETFAVRVAYHHFDRDDFYDAITGVYSGDPGTRDLDAGRIGLRWAPTDQLEFISKTDFSDLDFGGNVVSSFGADMWRVEQNGNLRYRDKSVRSVLDARYHFKNGITLSSLSGIQHVETVNNVDVNGSDPLFYMFNSAGDADIVSQELNLISPEDQRLRWVVGAFYQKQEIDIPYWQDGGFTFTGFAFGGGFILSTDFPWGTSPWDKEEKDWALFAHVAYDLTPQLELEVGLRHSDYETEQRTEWVFGFGDTPPVIPWPFTVPPASLGGDKQDLSENSLDGTVGLNWTVSDDHFLYGLVSRGHVTGGINIFPPFFDYDEMEVWNYELGWKATWLDGRMRTQINGFYETFDNYQALFAEALAPGGTAGPDQVATFRNAEDDSNIYGLELSGQAVFGGLSLDLGVSFLESELGTFSGVQDPFQGNATVDLTGAQSPFAAKRTGNIGGQYTFHIGEVAVTPRADYAWIDKSYASLWHAPQNKLKSRNLLALQLNFEWQEWWARGWMTNALDEEYVGAIQNNGTLRYAAPPRMGGVRVGRTF